MGICHGCEDRGIGRERSRWHPEGTIRVTDEAWVWDQSDPVNRVEVESRGWGEGE